MVSGFLLLSVAFYTLRAAGLGGGSVCVCVCVCVRERERERERETERETERESEREREYIHSANISAVPAGPVLGIGHEQR